MEPRRRNQEGDLPQTSMEEEQVVDVDATHGGGSSSNLVGEVAPPQSEPSVDLEGVLNQDGVNTTSNFNGTASIPATGGLDGQPHVENFPPHVASPAYSPRESRQHSPPPLMWRDLMMREWENCHHVAKLPYPHSTSPLTNLIHKDFVNLPP
ncbi:hypothetical protein LINGRAHAP2_LOCUS30633 [Linum grandiflorum]